MRHFTVKPVRTRARSQELAVEVSRVVGYRCEDGQGWRGPVRSTVREARADRPTNGAETTIV